MVAKMTYDRGLSILSASQFNYDGNSVNEITDEQARDILGFTIEKKPCYTEDGIVIPRMSYLRRSDGGIVDANCSVGDEFEVTSQPLETYEFAKYIMTQVPGLRLETVATMYNGGSAFVCLSQGDSWLVRGDTSPHNTNVLLCNPLTRGKFHLVSHAVRVVCMNTLQAAMTSGEGYRISHTKYARAAVENALELLRGELKAADILRLRCEHLANKMISTQNVENIMNALYPLPVVKEGENTNGLTRMTTKRNEVINQFEQDDSFTEKSFYTFLSANTYQMEHPLHKQERTDNAQVAFENIVGNRANRKGEILEAVWWECDRDGGALEWAALTEKERKSRTPELPALAVA